MRILLVLLVGAWIVATAHAAFGNPFLICNPDASGTFDLVAYQEGSVVTKDPLVGSACHADLAVPFAIPGKHTFTVWFESSLNGAKSVSVPFSFTPAANGAPGPVGTGVSAK